MKKNIFIDNYINEIKGDRLETINSSSSTNLYHETIINPKNEKINFFKDENEAEEKEENNNYSELNCREKITKLKHLKINNQNIIQINSKVYSNLSNLNSLD